MFCSHKRLAKLGNIEITRAKVHKQISSLDAVSMTDQTAVV